jgi:hypothetical protein
MLNVYALINNKIALLRQLRGGYLYIKNLITRIDDFIIINS